MSLRSKVSVSVSKVTTSRSHEDPISRTESGANLVHGKKSYIELEDSAHRGPRTDIFSHGPGSHEEDGILTETTIHQSTNSTGNLK